MVDTALATVDLSMLDRALESEGHTGSVMDILHSFKIYNAKVGDKPEADKAGKFKIKESGTGTEIYSEGSFTFNPLNVSYFYSGSIYPILADGTYAEKKVFFFTNEFSKFAKKSDTVGLAANNKGVGFFTKGDFEEMIKSPQLNGGENQFYDRKKNADGKPYNGSQLKKGVMVYGQFVDGPYKGDFFRMPTSTGNIGVTFRDGAVCDPDEGTFEYAVNQGLVQLNDALRVNGRKEVRSINYDQVDVKISIRENDKGIFLPVFEYAGLVAMRGENNQEYVKYIHDLKEEHFKSIFGPMQPASTMLIGNGNVQVNLGTPAISAPSTSTEVLAEDAEFAENDAFADTPKHREETLASHNKEVGKLEF